MSNAERIRIKLAADSFKPHELSFLLTIFADKKQRDLLQKFTGKTTEVFTAELSAKLRHLAHS